MIDVVMPQMGESIVEGTLTKWLKKPGERVERDEPLFEISTDKVDTEIPSPAAARWARSWCRKGPRSASTPWWDESMRVAERGRLRPPLRLLPRLLRLLLAPHRRLPRRLRPVHAASASSPAPVPAPAMPLVPRQ